MSRRGKSDAPGLGPLFGDAPVAGAPDKREDLRDTHAGILVGTSGYSFADWVGPFYPPGARPADFLQYYARHFPVVEVNATYYRPPDAAMLERMERKTPPGFRFVVKLHQAMTHEGVRETRPYRDFVDALAPLKDQGKYDGLLAQFPWSFKRTPAAVAHLTAMRERLPAEPLWAEFRHASWAVPELRSELEALGIGYCAVDEPPLEGLMPPIAMRTTADGYVRFHGRNSDTWWGRSGGDRYDYDYRKDELEAWLGKIRELSDQARRTYLFFNNCHAGQAARSAKLMQALLKQEHLV